MVTTRRDACQILGVSEFATESQIKTAFKNLVKQSHPDSGLTSDATRYRQIQEAYDFLRQNPAPKVKPKIIGSTSHFQQKREEQEAFDRWYEKRQEERKRDFERRVAEEHQKAEQKKKQEDEYRKAMEAINNIILAETIKSIIANSKKDQ